MAASEEQIKANKKNAKKSTGPKTKEGKKVASQNAVKHGLYAKSIIVNSPHLKENKQEYLDLVKAMFDELAPDGVFQEQLVLKIANCLWRQKRVIMAETAHINNQLDDIDEDEIYRRNLRWGGYDEDDPESMEQLEDDVDRIVENRAGMAAIPYDEQARSILRYEMRLDRQLTRAYRLLRLAKEESRLKREQEKQSFVGQERTCPSLPSPTPATNRQERVPDGAQRKYSESGEYIGGMFTDLNQIPTIDEIDAMREGREASADDECRET